MIHCTTIDSAGDVFDEAVGAILRGEIVAYPTDTLYGLAVDPRRTDAVTRLGELKAGTGRTGLPLVAASLAQVESALGPLPSLGRRLAGVFWPGPLTIVYLPTVSLPAGVAAADGSVAVRVPASELARRLALAIGFPITATSANPPGVAPASTGAEVARLVGPAVSVILEQPGLLEGAPSTIVDTRGPVPVLVRAGVVPWDRVLQSAS